MLPSSSSSSSQSKFCKVCRDAGCPESEYTSHCVKINGEVVCPTLLNQACRICKIKGHTSSYCPDRKPLRYQHEEPRRQEESRRDDRHGYYPREEFRRQEEPRRDDRHGYYPREEPRRQEEPRRDDHRGYYPREEPRRQEEPRRDDRHGYYPREEPRRQRQEEPRRDDRHGYYPRDETRRQHQEEPRRDDRHGYYPREEPRRQEDPRRDHRIRLNLEAPALCASKHAVAVVDKVALDVRAVDIHHAEFWSDEDVDKPFMCDPREMCREFIDSLATQEKYQSQNQ